MRFEVYDKYGDRMEWNTLSEIMLAFVPTDDELKQLINMDIGERITMYEYEIICVMTTGTVKC